MPAIAEQRLELTPIGTVLAVSADTTIQKAIRRFHENGILSCPVYRGSSSQREYIGIVSVQHIVGRMMKSFNEPSSIPEVDEDQLDESNDSINANFDALPSEYAQERVEQLQLDPFEPVSDTATLAEMLAIMVTRHLKRVPVRDAGGKLVNFASQSLILKQLAQEPALLGALADTPLGQAVPAQDRELVSVSAEDSVLDAFEHLTEQNISAVPVLDGDQLLGEINARQAYYISIAINKMRLLGMTCREFIVYINRKERWNVTADILHLSGDTPFAQVLKAMAEGKRRRVYVCNADGTPQRVVSLPDVLRAVHASTSEQ